MCHKNNAAHNHPLFQKDAKARQLWEACFPDPRTFDSFFEQKLAEIQKLAQQNKKNTTD